MNHESIENELKTEAEEALDLLCTLAQIPSPTWEEDRRAYFCKSWLEEAGCEGVYLDKEYNVIYPYCVTDDKPIVVFAAHTDVVFPDTEPLPIKETEDRIYCPGIYDDTVNLVNILLAARYLTQHAIKPKDCGILFVCDTCEEGSGNLAGVKRLFSDYKGRIKEFYTFDLVYTELVNCAVGSCRYRVKAHTEGGHSYLAFGNDNAIQKMSSFVEDLYQIDLPPTGKSSYNAGMIQGGTSINTIAQECSLLCEYRSDDGQAMEALHETFAGLFEKHGLTSDVIGLRPGEKLSDESKKRRAEMLDQAEAIIKRITGETPKRISSSTDCNIPLSLDIPAICLGTCIGHGAHTREEYLEKSSLFPGRLIATELILSYCE